MRHIIKEVRFGLFHECLPVVRFSSVIPGNRENEPNFAIVTYRLLSLNALIKKYSKLWSSRFRSDDLGRRGPKLIKFIFILTILVT